MVNHRKGSGEKALLQTESVKTGSAVKEVAVSEDYAPTEFGGVPGVIGLLIFSHCVLYYFWIAQQYHGGAVHYPHGLADVPNYFRTVVHQIYEGAFPTVYAASIYVLFLASQFVLAAVLPGPVVKGLPVPSENNRVYTYTCNGALAWYITLSGVLLLHFSGIFRLTQIVDLYGSIMTCAIISADILSLTIYLWGVLSRRAIRMSGNFLYDFFMGSLLNPRVFGVDLKMWAEIRISWTLLFFLTLGACLKQLEVHGAVSGNMLLIVCAQLLYTNACQKGEECIPVSWDIFYEKYGWMLIFWNFAGVPFLYCFQSYYILRNNVQFSNSVPLVALFAVLFCAYYIWDTAQSQKARFRMQLRQTYVPRWTVPQLPWGTLENPTYLETRSGSMLLTDGWFRYARKIYYTADVGMALCWGLSCGFDGFLPYFYPIFFISMLLHRYSRDVERCSMKYGADWTRYCKEVPYAFIPYVI